MESRARAAGSQGWQHLLIIVGSIQSGNPSLKGWHNEPTLTGDFLFRLAPNRSSLSFWIILTSYFLLCGTGGNIDDKMAPSSPVVLPLLAYLTHTCRQEWASLPPGSPGGLEVGFSVPGPPHQHHQDHQLSFDFKTTEKGIETKPGHNLDYPAGPWRPGQRGSSFQPHWRLQRWQLKGQLWTCKTAAKLASEAVKQG